MAKQTEKKFRRVTFCISNEAFANLEHRAKLERQSRSKVVSDMLAVSRFEHLNQMENELERDVGIINQGKKTAAEEAAEALRIRRGEGGKPSAMLLSLEAKLEAWYYQKGVFEELREQLANMPDDDETVIYDRSQNIARLKGIAALIEMAESLRLEEKANMQLRDE